MDPNTVKTARFFYCQFQNNSQTTGASIFICQRKCPCFQRRWRPKFDKYGGGGGGISGWEQPSLLPLRSSLCILFHILLMADLLLTLSNRWPLFGSLRGFMACKFSSCPLVDAALSHFLNHTSSPTHCSHGAIIFQACLQFLIPGL